uniref:UBX domain-containing protein n=1 Tax=Ananas comosus var. bracteatus TaxID=296719 RepID=A0A6V7Q2F0_ANACO|nr:unnamed protein product [Ananas comosus var. bracteatus]
MQTSSQLLVEVGRFRGGWRFRRLEVSRIDWDMQKEKKKEKQEEKKEKEKKESLPCGLGTSSSTSPLTIGGLKLGLGALWRINLQPLRILSLVWSILEVGLEGFLLSLATREGISTQEVSFALFLNRLKIELSIVRKLVRVTPYKLALRRWPSRYIFAVRDWAPKWIAVEKAHSKSGDVDYHGAIRLGIGQTAYGWVFRPDSLRLRRKSKPSSSRVLVKLGSLREAKRRRRDPMEAEEAKDRLLAISEELGHEIRVFMNSPNSAAPNETPPHDEEPDDFYDFTPEDYFRLMGDRIGAQSQVLKTRKIREAEAAARRARITKAVIRVRFPDNYVFEAKFQPSDKIQSLIDLLTKAIARPNVPFYLYTTPPKERIKDTSKDFYSAGFAPGAIVYFSYDLPKDSELNSEALTGPYLREDIRSLNGLELPSKQEQADPANSQQKLL